MLSPNLPLRLRLIAGFLVMGVLSACVGSADRGAMTAPLAPNQVTANIAFIKNAIQVGEVTGGDDKNADWTSQVTNANFKAALEDSLALAVLKGSEDAPYRLDAKLVSLHQPMAGFDMTVTATVGYRLLAIGKPTPVMTETVVTPYTANFSDAFLGAQRLRLGNEGAMRENIKEIISRLIKAAQPGGVLSARQS